MGKVHILPSEVISKIAAGEVIERPASVVKELVENSIDAGATSIEMGLKDAGRTLIHLKDNGSGIENEDLENIFLRHATSKIQTSDDLLSISSLGFRGEALYSIAAISDITLQSKTQDQPTGWAIHLRGGEKISTEPCSFHNHGTEIKVKELFFNTPARRNFLKSNTTELQQILSTFIPYCLLHPHVRFVLTHQDKTLIDVQPANKLIERIAQILHLDETHMIETSGNLQGKDCSIHLVLGDMNIKRARRDLQFIFINNRPVQSKNISFHLNQVYRLIMPEGTFPFFCAYINLPPADLDVNVHPAKREVKIKNEQFLITLLRSITEETLLTKSHGTQAQSKNTAHRGPIKDAFAHTHAGDIHLNEIAGDIGESIENRLASTSNYAYPSHQKEEHIDFFIPQEQNNPLNKQTLHHKLKAARYIGPFLNKFLLFESGESLLVIDQHAAQERIMYERLLRQAGQGEVEVQHLLSPVVVTLTSEEMLSWEEVKEPLNKIGLTNNQWDKDSIAIHSHPVFIKDIEKTVRNILAGERIHTADHDAIARRACRSSVMTGDKLNAQQAAHQCQELLECLDPFTCPHGRPTVIEINQNFLDKQFLRT